MTTGKILSNAEKEKLEEVVKAFGVEELQYMVKFIPLPVIWNEVERRLKESEDYRRDLNEVVKKYN